MRTRPQQIFLAMTLTGGLLLAGCSNSAQTACYKSPSDKPAAEKQQPADSEQLAHGSNEQPQLRQAHPRRGASAQRDRFDPFSIDVALASQQQWSQAPVFVDLPPDAEARRSMDAAVALYGEAPFAGNTVGHPRGEPILDGMESLQRVTFAGEGAAFDPCVSADGTFMVFASTQHRQTADIYRKSTDGMTITQLTADPAHDVMPSISPDGQRIAFASNRAGSWDIYVMSTDGGQAVQLTSDSTHELHPSWSPDGERIVFCRLGQVSGQWELWVMDLDQPVNTEFVGYGLFPEWCPVAQTGNFGRDRILFQRSRERGSRAFSIWTIEYKPGDASSPTEIAASQIAAIINPTWSPDGDWVVFATVPNPGARGELAQGKPVSSDLWLTSIEGTARVNLTMGRFTNVMPTWGPRGRVYFVSDRQGVDNIWSIGTDKAIAAATGQTPNRGVANVPTP